MKPKLLFENEEILKELKHDNQQLWLTSHRVRHFKSDWGENATTSIILNEVCSVTIHLKSYIVLIALACLTGLFSYSMYQSNNPTHYGFYFIVITVLLVVAFFFTRKYLITIASGGDKIQFEIKGLDQVTVMEFMDVLEIAKMKR